MHGEIRLDGVNKQLKEQKMPSHFKDLLCHETEMLFLFIGFKHFTHHRKQKATGVNQ